MKSFPPEELYYITHISNLQSILEHGIPSQERIHQQGSHYTRIYNSRSVSRRKAISTPVRRNLLDYANLHFQPRNPMMYGILGSKRIKEKLAVISISNEVMHESGVFITDGDASDKLTQFHSVPDGLKILERQWKIVQNDWWNKDDGSKRKIMAECLVPDIVKPDFISSVIVADNKARDRFARTVGKHQINVISNPHIFFQPGPPSRIGNNISVMQGDIFFSSMQTLTVTVNLQRVMGKGLALRTKYQFPDVYVKYEDACRTNKIKMRRPYLYKRETLFHQELADLSLPPSTPETVKWFLLFATKVHWRDDSRLDNIECGLDWVKKNYKKENIKSLAMPALGCGLGNLSWAEVGPVMCKYLDGLEIQVEIYLPREQKIDPQHLTETHLLAGEGLLPLQYS